MSPQAGEIRYGLRPSLLPLLAIDGEESKAINND